MSVAKRSRQPHTLTAMVKAYLLAICFLTSPLMVAAQQPPVGFQDRPIAPGNAPVSRGLILEQRFLDSTDWEFYYSLKDMPADLRELAFRGVGRSAVGPGEPFNTGDIHVYDSSSQHLYTAVNPEFVVVVWHQGSFDGPVTRALIYDRKERDACRYEFRQIYAIMSLESELKSLLRYKQAPGAGCRHLAPGDF